MDKEFSVDPDGLHQAVDLMSRNFSSAEGLNLPIELPQLGIGSTAALNSLAPNILGGGARLGEATSFAHMDPPTPWITWAMTLWNASLNQNLLHPATAPVARQMEQRVVAWLAPFFGMDGGHMTPGSTVANLTALWSARECAGVTQVIASEGAHLSIAKAAHILGLKYLSVPIDANGSMDAAQLPTDLSKSALVLTAGATSTGAIDPRLTWSVGQLGPMSMRPGQVHCDWVSTPIYWQALSLQTQSRFLRINGFCNPKSLRSSCSKTPGKPTQPLVSVERTLPLPTLEFLVPMAQPPPPS